MRFIIIFLLLFSQVSHAVLYIKYPDGTFYIDDPFQRITESMLPPGLTWQRVELPHQLIRYCWHAHTPVARPAPAPVSQGNPQESSLVASRLEQDRKESIERKLFRETRQTAEQIRCMEEGVAERDEKDREAFEEKHKSRIDEIAERVAARKAQLALAALTLAEVAVPVAAAPFVGPALFVASAAVVAAVAVDVIQTPWGPAHQSDDPASKELRDKIIEGDPVLHKLGKRGKDFSETGERSQFWSPAHPLTEQEYGKKYGMPPENFESADFLEKGKMKPDGKFVTRPAAPYKDQPGGSPEVVVEPGSVDILGHTSL